MIDLISFCSSKPSNVISVKFVQLCLEITIESLHSLISVRRFLFKNSTIEFRSAKNLTDYEFYPKNLSRWSFEGGRTRSFGQLMIIINHLGE